MKESDVMNLIFSICTSEYKVKIDDFSEIKIILRYIIKKEQYHHLLPLIIENISDFDEKRCQLKQQAKIISAGVIAAYISKRSILKKLSEKFTENNIRIILLKSFAYNDFYYKSPRGSGDIDILIEKSSNDEVDTILTESGFHQVLHKPGPFANIYEKTWKKGALLIDVHTALDNPLKYDFCTELLFKKSVIHPYYNNEHVRVLCGEDALKNLEIHFIKDAYLYHHSLIDFSLILASLRRDGINVKVPPVISQALYSTGITYEKYKSKNIIEFFSSSLISFIPKFKNVEKNYTSKILLYFVYGRKSKNKLLYITNYIKRKLKLSDD